LRFADIKKKEVYLGVENILRDSAVLAKHLERIAIKKAKLDSYRPLETGALLRLRDELSLEWTYNSNAIEGNTLTLVETKIIVQDGITIGGKTLREHFEVVNHQAAIDFITTLVHPQFIFTDRVFSDVHFLVLKNILQEEAGRYRTMGVRIGGANFTPPNALKVPQLMEELTTQFNAQINEMHPIVLATWFHHRMAWIHPFVDGNGRTIRLLFNLFLMSQGYPPAIILKADRKKYYTALNEANNSQYAKLLLLVCQATERSLDIYLSNIENYADNYSPISNIVKEEAVPYGAEYISLLARQGKIAAYKEGKVWFTSVKAVNEYMEGRERVRKLKIKN
jgi:Fic family protein